MQASILTSHAGYSCWLSVLLPEAETRLHAPLTASYLGASIQIDQKAVFVGTCPRSEKYISCKAQFEDTLKALPDSPYLQTPARPP